MPEVVDQSLRPLTISVVKTEKEFRELAQSWNRVAERAGGSLFLQHEWFDSAWAWRKLNSSLFIMLAWRDELLLGILPLVHVRERQRFPAIRALEFLTVPDTQACDLIADPDDRKQVIEAFCSALHDRRRLWDRLTLPYLRADSETSQGIQDEMSRRHYRCQVVNGGRNLYVSLTTSWDAYYGTRSRSLKKANNLAANRLKKAGEIVVSHITSEGADARAIGDALEQAIDISRRSWKSHTGNSLDQPGPGAFIRTLTQHAAARGWLSLWLLSIDNRPAAMEYQLLQAGNIYALRSDFDSESEEITPGSHLMRTLLESLFGKSMQRYYMGPGENAYKTRWTDDGDMLHQVIVHGKTWRGRVMRTLDEVLKPQARWLRDAFAARKPDGATAGAKSIL